MQFPLGTFYSIFSAINGEALRIQTTNPEEFDKARVVGATQNVNDLAQYFMVEKTGLEDDSYSEIC